MIHFRRIQGATPQLYNLIELHLTRTCDELLVIILKISPSLSQAKPMHDLKPEESPLLKLELNH